mmetsp:Transcript_110387/g.307545  ORF Transcript_110387/g.307545 Transcript_110387/m.307545 type:complete len:299 (-) Transcript_110387:513-1409(-)
MKKPADWWMCGTRHCLAQMGPRATRQPHSLCGGSGANLRRKSDSCGPPCSPPTTTTISPWSMHALSTFCDFPSTLRIRVLGLNIALRMYTGASPGMRMNFSRRSRFLRLSFRTRSSLDSKRPSATRAMFIGLPRSIKESISSDDLYLFFPRSVLRVPVPFSKRFADAASNILVMTMCPSFMASSRGVKPWTFLVLMSACPWIRAFAILMWPSLAAKCRGVLPATPSPFWHLFPVPVTVQLVTSTCACMEPMTRSPGESSSSPSKLPEQKLPFSRVPFSSRTPDRWLWEATTNSRLSSF